MIFRARPVVTLQADIEIIPSKVDLESLACISESGKQYACFEVNTCFSYVGTSVPPSVGKLIV